MIQYRVVITDLAGQALGEIPDVQSIRFKKVLNREGDCVIAVPMKSPSLTGNIIQFGQRDVYIYRNDDIVWGGRLVNDNGTITFGDDVATLVSMGFLHLFKKRLTITPKVNIDAGEIVWQWIDETQQVNNIGMNITKGTVVPSKNRERTVVGEPIYDEAVQLTGVKEGIDIEITQTKVYNSYYPQGTDKSDSVKFVQGKNIEKLTYSRDFSNPINHAIVEGGGYGEAMVTATVNNTALQGSYGLMQEKIPYKNVETSDLLIDKGEKEIIKRGLPRKTYTLHQKPGSDPDWTSLSVGDWIRVDLDWGYVSIHDAVRIAVIDVAYERGIEYPAYSFVYE